MTLPLPPWARVVQQSWIFHLVVAAVIAGGSVAFVCFGKNYELSWECLKAGLVSAGAYLIAALQHSPGSASFLPDGEVNHVVQHVVDMQEMKIPVKVVVGQ